VRTLYLIDAYAQIFRAFYAIRNGMNSPVTGEPTHAVFGFTGMLFKLFTQYKPDYVAVALDAPGKTFRDEMYSEYKATRNATPDDLHSQVPRIFELIEHCGIPIISKPGLEADDVMAIITCQVLADPACSDVQVRLVSKDKDLEQLLSDRAALFDIHTDTTLDVAGLAAGKGITPQQVIDYLALIGDSVDNVPGVEGIGPKTASQLLQQYGSIDGIYAHIEEIKGKRRENLEKARGHIDLSRRLVTLECSVDLGFSLEDARLRPMNLQGLLHLFQQLGFGRFQEEARRIAESASAASAQSAAPEPPDPFAEPVADQQSLFPAGEDAALALPGLPQTSAADAALPGTYRAVTTAEELRELVATLASQPMVSVDTETTGLGRDAALVGVSIAWKPGAGVYIPVRSPEPSRHLGEAAVIEALRPILESRDVPKCGHNLKFDALVFLRCGVHLRGVCFDSMLAASLLDPSRGAAKLDNLALSVLNYQMISISSLIGERSDPGQSSMECVPLDQITQYAAEDADIALRLYHALLPVLREQKMAELVCEVEAPLSAVIAEMEANGILCDPDELLRQGKALGTRVEELRRQIVEAAGFEFDVNSIKQLAEALFDRLGFKVGKKTKTGRSTDVEVLEKLALEEDRAQPHTAVPRLILEYRQLQKLISTYLGNLRAAIDPKDGRIHSTFHQLVTATGRLASHNPNLQNIPVRSEIGREIRKAFYAAPGFCLICADYSQIELRLLAHLSGDEALVSAFEKDLDIHAAVASEVFGVPLESVTREQRNRAKTINFGIIYGVTAYGLARRIEGLEYEAAVRLIADYKKRYAGIDAFLNGCIAQALSNGYVTTIMGRRRAIPEVHSSSAHTRSLGERLAINSVVQGSAADLIKLAMVNVQRRIDEENRPARLLLQIHDELIFESPEGAADEQARVIREVMEDAMKLRVPLRVDSGVGSNWRDAK
jgi:DNA polymerase I